MKLSMKWLNDFVDTTHISPKEFAEKMTMSGSKVESFVLEKEQMKNLVIGKILEIQPHPDANKLVVCTVHVGKEEPVVIVTGATNLKVGDIVPVALHKSRLPNGLKITKGKLRGVLSNGMLCSLEELNLTLADYPHAVEDGILVLTEKEYLLGEDVSTAMELDDTIVEFEITSNRPDCLGVLGLAREVAATFQLPLTTEILPPCKEEGNIHDQLKVTLKSPLCERYTAKMIKNVTVGPSPFWLRNRLRGAGLRPINNIVDITNYIMLELGHPIHAFDYDKITTKEIVIDTLHTPTSFTTLDDKTHQLDETVLAILDTDTPMAIAGIMGGKDSGVSCHTQTIVIEAANFQGENIRLSSKKLGIRTDSSHRFEKGLDSATTLLAIEKACSLIESLCCGTVVGNLIDCYPAPTPAKSIPFEPEKINQLLGTSIHKETMEDILSSLAFTFHENQLIPPSFRMDIAHMADIAEEVARIYGYDRIPSTLFSSSVAGEKTKEQTFEKTVETALLSCGLSEIMTYSFISPKVFDKLSLPAQSPFRDAISILNPLGEDTSLMRTTAITGMLDTLAFNYSNRNMHVALYEIATEYTKNPGGTLPTETKKIITGMYGDTADFFQLKGVVETLCDTCHIKDPIFEKNTTHPFYHPGRCANVLFEDVLLGTFGEIHPTILENYGLDIKAYLMDLDFSALYQKRKVVSTFTPLPKYPSSQRDLAFICEKSMGAQEVAQKIRSLGTHLLEDVSLFDVFESQQLGADKKSLAFRLVFRAQESTLTEGDITPIIENILIELQRQQIFLR